MKLIISYIFILSSLISFSQKKDSLDILFNTEWKVEDNWYLRDTLVLSKKLIDIRYIALKDSLINSKELTSSQVKRLLKYKDYYGLYFAFDSII